MAELEPPEAPIDFNVSSSFNQEEIVIVKNEKIEKKGFFKKLFSKKSKEEPQNSLADLMSPKNSDNTQFSDDINKLPKFDFNLPPLPENLSEGNSNDLPEMPEFTSIADSKKSKTTGKSKGKKSKEQHFSKSYETINLVDKFDWSQSIGKQSSAIEDSNRENQDIIDLINKAKNQVAEQQEMTKNNVFLSKETENNLELPEIPELPPLDIPSLENIESSPAEKNHEETNTLPDMIHVNPEISAHFRNLEKQHTKLRDQLNKKVNNPNFSMNKQEVLHLLKEYDEKIEEKIENKENELDIKFKKLQELNKNLNKKEKAITQMKAYASKIDKLLKEKELKINTTINQKVSSILNKKLIKEKSLLKKEIQKTIALNKQLDRKLTIIEKDKKSFDKKRDQLLNEEQNKLNSMQEMYEKKLAELTQERKEFEIRRKASMDLLKQADKINNELQQVSSMKKAIEHDKIKIHKEFITDKNLKEALSRAEKHLKKEKESLDKQMFSKYIESRLREIKPASMRTEDQFELSHEMPEIYDLIDNCRESLDSNNIDEGKKAYNKIKHLFENNAFEPREKAILFNTIRELYNEIQLKIIELQNSNI